jgi:fatty acid synthase subunit alpha, fungi type
MVEGARPLQAGDVCKAEACIALVVNTNAGKVVKVKGYVYRAGTAVIEVVSSFLYRGRFSDYYNTFETTEEPDYLVSLGTDADVGVLQSKQWFNWDDESKPLQPGTSLIFRIQSQVSFKDKTSYRNVSVAGKFFVRDQLKRLLKVGLVDFEQDDCQGNPVLSYLQRNGVPQDISTPLANEGYVLMNTEGTTQFNSPLTNEHYSKISGDFNPIHINPYFSDYASLPGTITHGLWSSVATRRYVENVVAKDHPERVLAYAIRLFFVTLRSRLFADMMLRLLVWYYPAIGSP